MGNAESGTMGVGCDKRADWKAGTGAQAEGALSGEIGARAGRASRAEAEVRAAARAGAEVRVEAQGATCGADGDAPGQGGALENLAAALSQQTSGYELLGRLFQKEVDAELLGALCAARYPAHTGNVHLDEGYRGLVVYLNHRNERTPTELNVDFLHTFIGNTQDPSHVAYPYESVYTSPEHLLMQDARDAVLAAYRSEKVALVNEHNEPEDHVGFELAFCAVLLGRAAEALVGSDLGRALELVEKERAFARDHLCAWVPEFASDVERVAQTGFYRALAEMLLGYIEVDAAAMEDVAEELSALQEG